MTDDAMHNGKKSEAVKVYLPMEMELYLRRDAEESSAENLSQLVRQILKEYIAIKRLAETAGLDNMSIESMFQSCREHFTRLAAEQERRKPGE